MSSTMNDGDETRTGPNAKPVARRRKPRMRQEIVAGLARRILSGQIPPGDFLPREPDLCAEYGVSRTVIREATKVLESKGLLRSRPRLGTEVLQANAWNMLDPDLLGWVGSDFHDPRFVDSLMEARSIIEPAAAELAATRASAAELAALERAYRQMGVSLPHDIDVGAEADMEFHTALLVASHNHVLACLAGVIRAAMVALFELTNRATVSHAGALDLHGEVVDAVRLRDPARARRAIEAILETSKRDLANLRAAQAETSPGGG